MMIVMPLRLIWPASVCSTCATLDPKTPRYGPGLSSVERVRAFITDFERRTDQPLPMTRAQIGRYLGLAEETVVRAFAALKRPGPRAPVVALARGKFVS